MSEVDERLITLLKLKNELIDLKVREIAILDKTVFVQKRIISLLETALVLMFITTVFFAVLAGLFYGEIGNGP